MTGVLTQLATLGPIGRLPVIGGFVATAAGLATAVAVNAATGTPQVLIACWGLLLALAMVALPKALAAGTPPRQIVLDRFAGIWLASAPLLPLSGTAATLLPGATALMVPLFLYHGLLAVPLRPMGNRPRSLPLLADDLIAATLTLLLAIGTMSALIAGAGATR